MERRGTCSARCAGLPVLNDFPPLLLKVHKGAAALAGKCLWVDESLITSLVKGVFVFAQH